MNANRVTGPSSPDPHKSGDQKIQREAAQRVEKVGEVDPDARARRFKKMMMEQESADEASTKSTLPSPFEPKFHLSSDGKTQRPDLKGLPSPSNSPPPDVSASASEHHTLAGRDLPHSGQFWEELDLPDQPIHNPHVMTSSVERELAEETGKLSGKKAAPPGQLKPEKKVEGSKEEPRGVPPPHVASKGWTAEEDLSSEESEQVSTRLGPTSLSKSKRDSASHRKGSAAMAESPEFETMRGAPEEEKAKRGRDKEHEKPSDIIAPALPALPAVIQAAAAAAVANATSYLSPEMMPLFFQMVGSMLIMSKPPGISRTEVTLNNPAFAGSKFFGSTIEIIKFSTAPDSFNIRLSGSNEAVAAFHQKMPSLMAAFQTGDFDFRIGRIDAEYGSEKPEKPLVRRKEGENL